MTIQQIQKIKNCRSFNDFTWTEDLDDFKRYNLIYGWNGSGKTTIADIFYSIQNGKNSFSGGDFRIQINGEFIDSSNLFQSDIPMIRVFNRAYIENNIFAPTKIKTIFFLGSESIEKQKEIQDTIIKLTEENNKNNKLLEEKKKNENDMNSLIIKGAKEVKTALSKDSSYANYNKKNFVQKMNRMHSSGKEQVSYVRNNERLVELKKCFEGSIKVTVPLPEETIFPDLNSLCRSTISILNKTIVATTLDTLKDDDILSTWVKQGLDIHNRNKHKDCQFCLQPLLKKRIKCLEEYFNDEFNNFINEITKEIEKINKSVSSLSKFSLPNKDSIAKYLDNTYTQITSELKDCIRQYSEFLAKLSKSLEAKKSKLFVEVIFDTQVPTDANDKLKEYISVLTEHNEYCNEYNDKITAARTEYEESIAATYIEEYKTLNQKVLDVKNEIERVQQSILTLSQTKSECEQEIRLHHAASDKINADLLSYLGHNELQLASEDNGYVIKRTGQSVDMRTLSEGEKTAIALLHFLSSLQDQDFNLKGGIVVIDDPVCSMDDGALFYAFSFIKERTKVAKQLFILTHNFMFFRQVKNWFQHIDKHNVCFYQTVFKKNQENRNSELTNIDSLLEKYESEYHYLFSLIYNSSENQETTELADHYRMPNVARRVLEYFFAFKTPGHTLHDAFEQSSAGDYDKEKKQAILRFVHTYSHMKEIGGFEHNPTILSSTPKIMKDILNFIEKADVMHYNGMINSIKLLRQNSKSQ